MSNITKLVNTEKLF